MRSRKWFGEKEQPWKRLKKCLTNETSEEDSEEDGDSMFDEEISLDRLSDEEQSMAEEQKESSDEEDEPPEEEDKSSDKEDLPSEEVYKSSEEEEKNKENNAGAANVSYPLDSSGYESGDTGIPVDFENNVSGKWIIAEFPVGRAVGGKSYVAKVIRSRNTNSLEVMCLRKKTKISFYFPSVGTSLLSPRTMFWNNFPSLPKATLGFRSLLNFFKA